MNPFEPLFWMGCIYFLLLALNRNQPKLLIWCGVCLGLGLENKHSTIFFLAALTVGLLVTSERRLLASKWFWVAATIALLICLPNLVWQYQHHFPTWEDLANVKKIHKNVELPLFPFLLQQIMMLNPASALVWIAGLGFLLFGHEANRYRALGVAYLAFLTVIFVLKGKDYYLAPIYPMLYAAGGVFWEILTGAHHGLRWMRIAMPAAVLALGMVAIPLVVPILPVEEIVPLRASTGHQDIPY
jgi:4-amino-4-deoxy-L-arabinose transferase-like glycosyltransferase